MADMSRVIWWQIGAGSLKAESPNCITSRALQAIVAVRQLNSKNIITTVLTLIIAYDAIA